jgi:hypothetical protein
MKVNKKKKIALQSLRNRMLRKLIDQLKTSTFQAKAALIRANASLDETIKVIRSNKKCEHDWQPDGQTMTSVRWNCVKCGKTRLNGIDI